MPRYRITTFDGIQARDPEDTELPDLDALERLLRKTLVAVMQDESRVDGPNQIWADAYDERNERMMTARISLSVSRPDLG